MTTAQLTAELTKKSGLSLNREQTEKLEIFERLLLEWNKKMNLTAITDSEGIAVKHFYDSLTPLMHVDIPKNSTVIDVGTGAGFPSIPLAIVRSDLSFTLLDSLNKRLVFLGEVARELGIKVRLIHMRAEDAARDAELREKFDVSISRAVAAMPVLCEYCIPFVKKGGMFIAMKGANADIEMAQSENAVRLLGGEVEKEIRLTLPDGSERAIEVIRKKNFTPKAYPRHGSKISKRPL